MSRVPFEEDVPCFDAPPILAGLALKRGHLELVEVDDAGIDVRLCE
jgi:hypothetical protein